MFQLLRRLLLSCRSGSTLATTNEVNQLMEKMKVEKIIFELEKKAIETEKRAMEEKLESERKITEEKVGRLKVEAEAKVSVVEAEAKVSVLEGEKKALIKLLEQANAELLRSKGVFSVRGMLDYIEEKFSEKFIHSPECKKYSRGGLYRYLAKTLNGLTSLNPEKFGTIILKIYGNYSKEIHDGKRSPEEVTLARDSIIIRESSLVKYEQIKVLIEICEYFKYPYNVQLRSRSQ